MAGSKNNENSSFCKKEHYCPGVALNYSFILIINYYRSISSALPKVYL